MNMLRLLRAGLAAAALAGVVLGASAGLADGSADGDVQAKAEEAISLAAALIDEQAEAAGDSAARERLHDTETALTRARNRFSSGNYDGALEHATDAQDILR